MSFLRRRGENRGANRAGPFPGECGAVPTSSRCLSLGLPTSTLYCASTHTHTFSCPQEPLAVSGSSCWCLSYCTYKAAPRRMGAVPTVPTLLPVPGGCLCWPGLWALYSPQHHPLANLCFLFRSKPLTSKSLSLYEAG